MKHDILPHTLTNNIVFKVSNITKKIEKLDNYTVLDKTPYLRKHTKINSIHSSLAIENNKLTIGQVKDIINEKEVIGLIKEKMCMVVTIEI